MKTEQISIAASDGFSLHAYIAHPEIVPKAGMVVLQEIFGVNAHIRSVTERWAAQGYLAIAPALFDRVRPDIELGYDSAGMQEGQGVRTQIPREQTIADVDAAVEWLRARGMPKVGVVGYCWGGSLAWMANTDLQVDATVSYYGGMISQTAHKQNHAPAMFHFGEQDTHIPPSEWEAIREAHPGLPVYTYPAAGHGFNCDARGSYDAAAAGLALERTLALFDRVLLGA